MSSAFSRESLLDVLRTYQPSSPDRVPVWERLIAFVESDPRSALRENSFGHLTGSAWVVNKSRTKGLLLHHRKLNRWMQTGGHADGEFDLLSVALREAREESGLTRIEPVSDVIFDVDIHEIPPFKDIPAHFHFDVRFLLEADESEPLIQNEESNGVAWVALTDITSYTEEESVVRMARLSVGAV
jgi:8-oxo-dGTP pyrophosphatase MutT (NUDIX family)